MKTTEKDPTTRSVAQGEQILRKLLLTRFSMRQLVAYIAVYDYRNIQAAAHHLYLDHSTVSKSISEIEAALNMKLFVRHTRGVTPTAAADVFYRHSKQIANQCTRTAAELARITTGAAIHVVIGCVSYLDTIAIKAVSRFKLQHDGKLVVRLLFGHTADLHRRLKLEEIDLVICRLSTHAEQPDIHAEKVYDVGDVIVVRPDHPCAHQPDITLKDLLQYPWILPPPNNPFRSYLESMFNNAGLQLPSNVFEIASTFASALALFAVLGVGVFGRLLSGGFDDPASASSQATSLLNQKYGGEPDLIFLVHARTGTVDSAAAQSAGQVLTATLVKDPRLHNVTSYFTTQVAGLRSKDGTNALVLSRVAGNETQAAATATTLLGDYAHLDNAAVTVQIGGALGTDINTQVTKDLALAESVAIPITIILLLFAFGSIVAAMLPLGIGILAILATFAELALLTHATSVSIFALNLTTTPQATGGQTVSGLFKQFDGRKFCEQ